MEANKWPTQSPDFNPTENLFGLDGLKPRLHHRPSCLKSISDFTNTLVAKWAKTPTATLEKLVENLPRTVDGGITAKRGQLHINAML